LVCNRIHAYRDWFHLESGVPEVDAAIGPVAFDLWSQSTWRSAHNRGSFNGVEPIDDATRAAGRLEVSAALYVTAEPGAKGNHRRILGEREWIHEYISPCAWKVIPPLRLRMLVSVMRTASCLELSEAAQLRVTAM
jgi:hypothetical protein